LTLLLVLGAALAASSASSAFGAAGVVLRQRQGPTYLKVTVSPAGARTTRGSRKPVVRNGKSKPGRLNVYDGFSIRYSDGRLFALDFVQHTFSTLLLKAALADSAAEDAIIANAVPRFEEASENDSATRVSSSARPAKPKHVPASFGPVTGHKRIAGLRAEAHILKSGTTRERVWIATTLPRPPSDIARAIRRSSTTQTASPIKRAMARAAGRIVLRVEVRSGKRWRRLLNTTSADHVNVGGSTFDAPKGFVRTAAQSRAAQMRGAVRAARSPATLRSVPALVRRGPGPISEHPEPYIFFWGHDFAAHPEFRRTMNNAVGDMLDPAYMNGLRQYGIGPGRVTGNTLVDSNPPSDVGNANFVALGGFILTHRYGYTAPKVWLTVGGHDPLIIILVAKDAVDSAGWGGYHFFVPTEASLVPWPASMFVHDAMPWLVAKVDKEALDVEATDPYHRHQCHGELPAVSAAVCAHLGTHPSNAGLDHTTELVSHELVETIVDPYPFLGWADFGKVPVWTQGEISDICALGATAPFARYSIALATVVASYWSNNDGACVPEMRPSVTISTPASDGAIEVWHRAVSLFATASDPIDGNSLPVTWRVDGGSPTSNLSVLANTTANLALGPHTIAASASDSQGLTATATRQIVVTATPPDVTITSPAAGATFGDDETRPYRADISDAQDGRLAGSSVQWWLDGLGTGTFMGNGAAIAYKITAQGTHTVTVQAVNSAGLATQRSVTVNIGPPSGNPTVVITAPPDGTPVGATLFHLTAVANSPVDGPLPGSAIHWSTDRDPGWSPTGDDVTYDARGSCSFGLAHFTATTTDSVLHTASDTISLFVGTIC
jgi:hypothetical protein